MEQLIEGPRNVDSHTSSNNGGSAWGALQKEWQWCIEEAWTSYCKGSLPIGAVIIDEHGKPVGRGRNRIYEEVISEGDGNHQILRGNRLAHAEINALLKVDWREVDPKTCTLYTTTEPCPLCVGAVRLARIRTVFYASRDTGAGSADLFTANTFMQKPGIRVTGPEDPDMETILTAMLVEMTLRREDNNMSLLYGTVAKVQPGAAEFGKYLLHGKILDRWKKEGCSAACAYDQLSVVLHSLDFSTEMCSHQMSYTAL